MMFLAVLALAAAPRAVVVVTVVGVSAADEATFTERVGAEMRAADVDPATLPAALAMKPDCLREPACARNVVRAGEASWLLRVDLLRGGSNVQIAAALLDGEGQVATEARAIARVDELLAGKPILPQDIVDALRALAEPPPPPPAAVSAVPRPAPAPVAPTPVEPAPAPEGPSTITLAGIGGVAVGITAAMIGVFGAASQYSLARDPAAVGSDKETASVLVPVLGVVAIVGLGVAGASAWLLASEG